MSRALSPLAPFPSRPLVLRMPPFPKAILISPCGITWARFSRTRTLPRCFRRGYPLPCGGWPSSRLCSSANSRPTARRWRGASAHRLEVFRGLELTDPGFDFSVLCEFRDRLLAGSAAALLLDKLPARCRTMGLLTVRGQQRTDSTHVLAAIRVMNRLELVAETLRAALNALATVAPTWLQALAPPVWYERYGTRIEDTRLPQGQAKRDAYAQVVGEDGFALLDALEALRRPSTSRNYR